jgi:spore maturation protein CgeB
MKILYFERKYTNSYSYYNEIRNAIARTNTMYQFADWSPVGGPQIDIHEVLARCPETPDLIMFGFGWTDCSDNPPNTVNGLDECGLPVSIILNKEYSALQEKLDWIKECDPIVAFTVHHDYNEYGAITGIPFHQIPFAVNPDIFKRYSGEQYDCDFGFSGVIRPEQTNDWRAKIVKKSAEWSDINFSYTQHRHDSLESYARRLNRAKVWLSTTGPADLVGTRYYETMALGTTLLACNKFDRVYDDIIEEDKHCIMFDSVDQLQDKVRYYLNHDDERMQIVENAKEHALGNHTWDHRAQKINNVLTGIMEG